MSTSRTDQATVPTQRLRERVKGRVISPDDTDYDAVRGIMLGGTDPRPAVVFRPTSDDDVVAALAFARESGLPLAVRSGGHSSAGYGTAVGGLVIDLRDMKGLDIDVEGRTAWAESGLTAGEFTEAANAHGLAVGFGDTGSVGLGGLTTGGGVGYLARKYGLTVDNLLAADVVTADGRVLRVDEKSHPDLFWAIRGGGGNFGVVTRFQFRLQEVGQIVGGMICLPATAETVAGFIAAAEAAPDELTTIANVMNCPPMPFIPEEHHGSSVILGMLCFAGPEEDGLAAMTAFTDLAEPLANMLAPMPYPGMYPPEDPDYHPTAVSLTMFMDSVDAATAQTVVDAIESSDAMLRAVQLRVLGGAVAKVPADATAYAHRSSRLMTNVAAFYNGPEDKPVRQAWIQEVAAALHQSDDGAYVNFLGDEGPDRIRAAYPGTTYDRLAAVKAEYDPTNLFRLNQNIPPATTT